MAPAATDAQGASWAEQSENNVNFELGGAGASSSGNGSVLAAEPAGDHGWQKVTNPKRARRLEKVKPKGGLGQDAKNGDGDGGTAESKVFEDLEKQAEARRARRKSRQDAWTAAAATANGGYHGGEDEHSDVEFEERDHVNGEAKKKQKRAKKPKVTIANAAAAIDTSDLEVYLSDLSEALAIAPDIQLIRCVDYFVKAFSSVSTSQFSWDKISKEPLQKSLETPTRDLPEAVCKITSDWLAKKPVDVLSEFALWAMDDVLLESQTLQKGGRSSSVSASSHKTKAAVIVVLALLFRRKPEALLMAAEILRSPKFRGPTKLPTLVWAYGQAAQGDLLVGMSLWVQNLLPLAVGNSSTPILRDLALQFIESIFLSGNIKKSRSVLLNGASRKGERLIPPSALNALLHMAYPPSRTKATDRFLAIYPMMKEVALGGSFRSKSLKPVAQQLLPLALVASAEDAPGLSREACSLFRWCLSQTADCYKQWEKLHLEKLKGSTRVLEYLCGVWKESESLLAPPHDLKSTVSALRIQHLKALETKDDKLEADVKKADAYCKILQKNMSRVPSCIKATATLACAVAVGYGLYLLNPNVNPWNWDEVGYTIQILQQLVTRRLDEMVQAKPSFVALVAFTS